MERLTREVKEKNGNVKVVLKEQVIEKDREWVIFD